MTTPNFSEASNGIMEDHTQRFHDSEIEVLSSLEWKNSILLYFIVALAILSFLSLGCLVFWALIYRKEAKKEKEEAAASLKPTYWKNEYTPGKGGLSQIHPPIMDLQKWNSMTGYSEQPDSNHKRKIILKKFDSEERKSAMEKMSKVTQEGGQTWKWKENHSIH
ncbi:DgyrCDS2467 [Dimorphilus gyrociliatus]|uniref:DgyrCDS2467 n=1 Tax=Dimorphilus gyrociliatus TaxID=2664684 RepID=A0A7I8VAE6_9ANNE|nr:DgyrCDS2467 [Dimorphilus gyrociliatus]